MKTASNLIALAKEVPGLTVSIYGYEDASGTDTAGMPMNQIYEYGLTLINSFWPYFNLLKLVQNILSKQPCYRAG